MMTRKWLPIALMAIGVLSVPIAAQADTMQDWIKGYFVSPEVDQPPQPIQSVPLTHPIQYGRGDGLTKQQSDLLRKGEIAFPQSYQAVINKLSYPDGRETAKDYYRLDDGKMIAIVYTGTTATGIEGL